MSDHVPTPWTPGDAYGQEGPGTLDRDARETVRANDPYAPKPRQAPAVPSIAAARAAARAAAARSGQARPTAPNAFASPKGPFGTGASGFGVDAPGFSRAHEREEAGIGDQAALGVYGVPPTRPAAQQSPQGPAPRKGSVAPPGM